MEKMCSHIHQQRKNTCLETSHRCKLTATYFSLLNMSKSLPKSIWKLWNSQKQTFRNPLFPTLLLFSDSCISQLVFSPTRVVFFIGSDPFVFCLFFLAPKYRLSWVPCGPFLLLLSFWSRYGDVLKLDDGGESKEPSLQPKGPRKTAEAVCFSCEGWWLGGQSQASARTECIAKFKKIDGSDPLGWLFCLLNIFSPSSTSGLQHNYSAWWLFSIAFVLCSTWWL